MFTFIKKSLFRRYLFLSAVVFLFFVLLYLILDYFQIGLPDDELSFWAIVLIIFSLFSALYYFQVVRPFQVLTAEVQSLLAKKKYRKVMTDRLDEIGVMAYFFNKVVDSFGEVSFDIKDRNRMISELSVASELQRDILPTDESPAIPGLEVVAKNKPATELGGDSFNFFSLKDKTYIYVGDVTGHGVAAGLIMTMVNSLISVFADLYDGPYEILVNVNKYIKKHVKKAMFMTLVMLCWDHKKQRLSYVGAGHEHILVYRAASGQCEAILSGGVALGMVPDNSKVIKEEFLDLDDGDFVVLYSDGITEAKNEDGELFGLERLQKLIVEYATEYSVEGVNHHIAQSVTEYMGKHGQDDDITLIVMKKDADH